MASVRGQEDALPATGRGGSPLPGAGCRAAERGAPAPFRRGIPGRFPASRRQLGILRRSFRPLPVCRAGDSPRQGSGRALLVSGGTKVYNPADKHFRQRCLWRQHDSADVSGDRCGRHAYRCRALRTGRHPGRGQGAHLPRRSALFGARGTGRSGKGSGRKVRPRGPGTPACCGPGDRGHHPGRQRPGAGPGRPRGPGAERRAGSGARPFRHRGRCLHPARRSGPSRRGSDASGYPSSGRGLRRLEEEGRTGRGLRGQVLAPQCRA